jgi:hypothetical protein
MSPRNGSTDGSDSSEMPSGAILGYLSCPQDAANGFLGAMLITDSRARPLHFAFVSPVRPTAMQRLLYGATLAEHVKVDVIAKKLMQGLPFRPSVVFVDSSDMVNARRVVGLPTAFLTKNEQPLGAAANLSMLRYDTHGHAEDQDAVGVVVSELEPWIDLIEPFSRLMDALKEAQKTSSKS